MSQAPPFLLDELARISPFFALGSEEVDGGRAFAPVTSLVALTPAAGDRLARTIDGVGVRLATSHRWIAASILFQGWAARLTSVYAGSIVLGGAIPDLSAPSLRYRFPESGPVELVAAPLLAVDAEAGWRQLTDGHLSQLARAVRAQVRIGARLLHGNVASAMAGSLMTLAETLQVPLEGLLEQPWAEPADLAPYGRWIRTEAGLRYARNTCCGYDQIPGGGRCGDCSLDWRR